MQYLARWRMQLAARRLEIPGISIAQVAAEVGYESEAAFNRSFKKYVGTPPGAWRKGRIPSTGAGVDTVQSPIASRRFGRRRALYGT